MRREAELRRKPQRGFSALFLRFAAKGGYEKRPDAIPLWVERSGVASRKDVDTITSATPKSGKLEFSWDLTDASGARVPDGTYRFEAVL